MIHHVVERSELRTLTVIFMSRIIRRKLAPELPRAHLLRRRLVVHVVAPAAIQPGLTRPQYLRYRAHIRRTPYIRGLLAVVLDNT